MNWSHWGPWGQPGTLPPVPELDIDRQRVKSSGDLGQQFVGRPPGKQELSQESPQSPASPGLFMSPSSVVLQVIDNKWPKS